METTLDNNILLSSVIKTQPKNEDNENFKEESIIQQNDTFLHCKNCSLLTFTSSYLANHNCNVEIEKILCPGYFLCKNSFFNIESLKIHLRLDHNVKDEKELENFLNNVQPSNNKDQNMQIVGYKMFKKSDNESLINSRSKSKISIKDVTLLRKPDLPATHINLPNIFDSLDLTNEEDIFDDFLATDNEPEDFDFDFEEPNNDHDDEIIAIPDSDVTQSGKIYVRKNLCNNTNETCKDSSEVKNQNKIFVRSHESLTNQVIATDIVQQQSECNSDCVIVSSENVKKAPTPNKIFIRNIETLTNHPQTQEQFYDSDIPNTNSNSNYLNRLNSNFVSAFPPAIYVKSYDSLKNETNNNNNDNSQQKCKISIKNMDTLIEPSHQSRLMHPPPGITFGHPQNLINMRPNQNTDENLINYRDTSVTPDTLPGSSNVSTCGGNDNDVIILDELNENSFVNFPLEVESQANAELSLCNISVEVDKELPLSSENMNLIEENIEIENPERNHTPNDKSKIDISVHNEEENIDQPMTRIPLNITTENKREDILKSLDLPKKKMKIVKIVRVKKKISSDTLRDEQQADPLATAFQVIYKCNLVDCSLSFSSPKILNYHKRCHLNDGIEIVCPECKNGEFKNFNSLHTHLWRQHSIDMDLFSCKLCNFKTPILSRLKNFHEKIHSQEKKYKCEFTNCNRKFCNSKQLKNHSKIHKIKKSNNSLVRTDAKKIRCQICDRGFASESGLYIHFMEHKNDEKKRFTCEEKSCQYSTNDHNSFRRHKFQHTKTHQYSCPACNYRSIQSNTYRKHLEKQHKELADELLYKCNSCKFITISKSKYEGHISKHLVNS